MDFNFTDVIFALSCALDHVEHELTGTTAFHGKRVAAIAAAMGKKTGLTQEQLLDLMGCAVMHDCALTEYVQAEYHGSFQKASEADLMRHLEIHCTKGEEHITYIPFRGNVNGAVLYHHENADGSGPFGKESGQIPDYAKWIHLAEDLDSRFDLSLMNRDKYQAILIYLLSNQGILFDKQTVELFQQVFPYEQLHFLKDGKVNLFLSGMAPSMQQNCTPEQLMHFSKIFAVITDYKSRYTRHHSVGVADKAFIMGIYYGAGEQQAAKLYVAGAFHDIGTLVIDKDLLEKPDKLTDREYQYIKSHIDELKRLFAGVTGMEDIIRWASRHHEKLDGSGYPMGFTEQDLDQWDRLIACLDIYQALIEKRSYKESVSHDKAMIILRQMAKKKELDEKICEDIGNVFMP
jgi:HD-GYP domain-containing protein (c-di-GMP phosphodiesterase class II)